MVLTYTTFNVIAEATFDNIVSTIYREYMHFRLLQNASTRHARTKIFIYWIKQRKLFIQEIQHSIRFQMKNNDS